MKDNQSPDPVESLIRAAKREMSRLADAGGLGLECRLSGTLGEQTSAVWSAWEAAAWQGMRVAVAVTALIAVESGISIAFQTSDEINLTAWTVERTFLGI